MKLGQAGMAGLQQAGQFANSKLADTENLQGMMPQGEQQPPQEPE